MRSCPKRFPNLTKSGVTVRVQRGAGVAAAFPDDQYEAAGAALIDDAGALVSDADLVVTVGRPSDDVLAKMRRGAVLIGFFNPLGDPDVRQATCRRGRHGAGDGDDSAHHARAVDGRALVAKQHRRLQSGADRGVANCRSSSRCSRPPPERFRRPKCSCSAPASPGCKRSRRRAAWVRWSPDTTCAPPSKNKCSRSARRSWSSISAAMPKAPGGYAKELTPEQQERQRAWMVEQIGKNDVVITTALVPGRKAPILVTEAAVAAMKPGSVIVDLAAEAGGNCALTVRRRNRHDAERRDASSARPTCRRRCRPMRASLYSRNVYALLSPWIDDGELDLDMNDEIAKGACVAPRRCRADRRERRVTDIHHFSSCYGLRPGRVRRLRSDLEGADDAAHAADVGDERHPRHRAGRRDRLVAGLFTSACPARCCSMICDRRRNARRDQRLRRIHRDRTDAADVQAARRRDEVSALDIAHRDCRSRRDRALHPRPARSELADDGAPRQPLLDGRHGHRARSRRARAEASASAGGRS